MGVEIEFGRSVVEVEERAIRLRRRRALRGRRRDLGGGGDGERDPGRTNCRPSPGRAGGRGSRPTCDSWRVRTSGRWATPRRSARRARRLLPAARPGRDAVRAPLRAPDPARARRRTDVPVQVQATRASWRPSVVTRRSPSLPGGAVVKGTAGWLAWLGLHLWYLVGFRNRLRVMINWTWRYFDWPSGPRLIVADAETAE